jgi:hypothetical protein
MLSDLDLARLELDTYAARPAGEVIAVNEDRIVITRLPDVTVISVMGTNDAAGWISDFKIKGVFSRTHRDIGVCESGFLDGAEALWTLLAPIVGTEPVVLQGHSRGAGMVPIIAAFAVDAAVNIERCICWEAPWCVGPVCRDLLLGAGVDGVQFWHGDDPVPTMPAVPWLVSHVWPVRHFGSWKLDAAACHSMAGIVAELFAPPQVNPKAA